jgi:hypothetical protein
VRNTPDGWLQRSFVLSMSGFLFLFFSPIKDHLFFTNQRLFIFLAINDHVFFHQSIKDHVFFPNQRSFIRHQSTLIIFHQSTIIYFFHQSKPIYFFTNPTVLRLESLLERLRLAEEAHEVCAWDLDLD